jgi:hypothetical protein
MGWRTGRLRINNAECPLQTSANAYLRPVAEAQPSRGEATQVRPKQTHKLWTAPGTVDKLGAIHPPYN